MIRKQFAWGILLVAVLIVPVAMFAAPSYIDDFEDGIDGTDLEDYDSFLGEYFVEGFNAFARIVTSCPAALGGGANEACVENYGGSGSGSILRLFPNEIPGDVRFLEFDYTRWPLSDPFNDFVTIIGENTTSTIGFAYEIGGGWGHFSWEISEPIVEVQLGQTDHASRHIDNISFRACEECK